MCQLKAYPRLAHMSCQSRLLNPPTGSCFQDRGIGTPHARCWMNGAHRYETMLAAMPAHSMGRLNSYVMVKLLQQMREFDMRKHSPMH